MSRSPKTLSTAWLTKQHACAEGIAWFKAQPQSKPVAVLRALIADGKLAWANWLIVRVMTYRQYVAYAIYAAEQGLPQYEQRYPDDPRPRQAIEAARACLKHPSATKKAAARAAAAASWAAAGAAMREKILQYGLGLLEGAE